MKRILLLLLPLVLAMADGPGVIESSYSKKELPLNADPASKEWKRAKPVIAEHGPKGESEAGLRTEIRSRWTDKDLYVLFTCPYDEFFVLPNPSTTTETNKLWERDVAEIFAGADFDNVFRYREFQVSPQGEWVDLDIDRKHPLPEGGWNWNSGFAVKARIDAEKKIWYGEFRIPIASIDARPVKAGHELRINFFRIQGPARREISWQPTGSRSFHVPEAFGRLRLVK